MIQIFINNMLNFLDKKPIVGAITSFAMYTIGIIVPIEQTDREIITWILQNCAFLVTILVGAVTIYAKFHHNQKKKKK